MSKSNNNILGRRELSAALALILPVSAFAAITPAAGGATVTPGAVPVVNIVAPNGAGVSHNQFGAFSVDTQGVVLNNSAAAVQSQLAGQIAGNANLAGGAARVIITEVTGTTPTALNGALEIAGQRAALIVANPNGISADGGSFINAARVTLTTGTPELGGAGRLNSINVGKGVISVSGKGLDATGAERADLFARSVELNAKLQAKDLAVVTGTNKIGYNNGRVTATEPTGTAPTVAVDVGLLGSMYADSIRMLGTEKGVGVNLGGTVQSLKGELSVDAQGAVKIAEGAVVKAQTNLGLYSGDHEETAKVTGVTIAGQAEAVTGSVDVYTAGVLNIAKSGVLKAKNNLSMGAGYDNYTIEDTGVTVAGRAEATTGSMNVSSTSTVDVAASGVLKAQNNLNVYSGYDNYTVENSGVKIAGQAEATKGSLNVLTAGAVDIAESGTLKAGQNLGLSAGYGRWDYLVSDDRGVSVAGKVDANVLSLRSAGLLNIAQTGVLTAKNDVYLRAGNGGGSSYGYASGYGYGYAYGYAYGNAGYAQPSSSGINVAGKVASTNGSLYANASGAVNIASTGSLKAQKNLSISTGSNDYAALADLDEDVGLNVAGSAEAVTGSTNVSSSGAVKLAGTGSLKAQKDLYVAASDVDNAGTLTATKGNIVVRGRGIWAPPSKFSSTGTMSAGGKAYVSGFDDKEVKGTIKAGTTDFLLDEYGNKLKSGSEDHSGAQARAYWSSWMNWAMW